MEDLITLESVESVISELGLKPVRGEDWVEFTLTEAPHYSIIIDQLPMVFVSRSYNVDPADWDMELFKQAAHRLSDELAMVKAIVDEKPGSITLRFLVAAIERTTSSLKSNLMTYVELIKQGGSRLTDVYHFLKKQKETMFSMGPFVGTSNGNNVLS